MNLDKTIKIMLASSSKLFLEGMKRILEGEKDIEIIAETSDPKDIEDHTLELKPNLLFIDNRILNLNIVKLSGLISKKSPDTSFIVLGNPNDDPPDVDLPRIKYLTKETDSAELIRIIKNGRSPDKPRPVKSEDTADKITKMESKVIELISNGYSNKEIAKRLAISEKTVKAHLTSIFMKLNLESRYQLIVYGTQQKRKIR